MVFDFGWTDDNPMGPTSYTSRLPLVNLAKVAHQPFWGFQLEIDEPSMLANLAEYHPQLAITTIRAMFRADDLLLIEDEDDFYLGWTSEPDMNNVAKLELVDSITVACRRRLGRKVVYAAHFVNGGIYPGSVIPGFEGSDHYTPEEAKLHAELRKLYFPMFQEPRQVISGSNKTATDDRGVMLAQEAARKILQQTMESQSLDEVPEMITTDPVTGDKSILGMPDVLIRGPGNTKMHPPGWPEIGYMDQRVASDVERGCNEAVKALRRERAEHNKPSPAPSPT